MISCAVEPSFSSTVTSINDPLCTVLAANLEGKKKTKHQRPFIMRRKKGDSIYSNRFKITFFLNNLLQVPYCPKPKDKHSPEKSINCPAHAYHKQVISVSWEQNRKRSSILLISLNNRCMWITLDYYIFENHLFIWYITFHQPLGHLK